MRATIINKSVCEANKNLILRPENARKRKLPADCTYVTSIKILTDTFYILFFSYTKSLKPNVCLHCLQVTQFTLTTF